MSKARDRLLETATRLFYAEGVRSVGIDRVIAEAGVAKATFYHHFASKDDLVVAYLTTEFDRQRARVEQAFQNIGGQPGPTSDSAGTTTGSTSGSAGATPGSSSARIRAIVTELGEVSCGPGFRGCPFLNAAAEFADPDHPVRRVVQDYRDWYRGLMLGLLTEAGYERAEHKADQLLLLRDGIAVSGGLGDRAAARAGTATALALV